MAQTRHPRHDEPGTTTGDGLEDVLRGVGPRLKALRQRRDVTLAELSTATGISVSTLSRLESGLRRPTLELLLPLAREHGVQLDELVDAPVTGDPRIHARPFVRAGRTFVPLTRRPGGQRAYKMIVPPSKDEPHLRTHEGHEWLYVLSGRIRLVLSDHDLVLRDGEVAEFDTRLPHWIGNPGPGDAEVLTLFGPQGERMHVRARSGSSTQGDTAPEG
ncbi:helix-turn-helix transcriptional regulator [Actinotalea ferrariae]|uniref:helix-turn-helix domain-containing protein n=1 Tax=Actinotalea ferrariae TaxID=1386098 RepID=UPI001C8C8F0E|nr:XRE family transcriptional regulator [Actinotalea ferrariae]MBX9243509.1 helix-turn-helix transcriptional regulator [Actinotalea ferrariae]